MDSLVGLSSGRGVAEEKRVVLDYFFGHCSASTARNGWKSDRGDWGDDKERVQGSTRIWKQKGSIIRRAKALRWSEESTIWSLQAQKARG